MYTSLYWTVFLFQFGSGGITRFSMDLIDSMSDLVKSTEELTLSNLNTVNEASDAECSFISDPLVIPVTPHLNNKGWALSPHEKCNHGRWCTYACAPGYYSSQWDPDAKCAFGPSCGSLNGGLLCNKGTLVKPFPSTPLCQRGMNNVVIKNHLTDSVAACQTVYPGNEVMLIPTEVPSKNQLPLTVPPKTYWLNTLAQYYFQLPGIPAIHGCGWGSNQMPVGNWSPYVVGAGQGVTNHTYVSLAWNLEHLTQSFQVDNLYTIDLQCESGECHGLPCQITPNSPSDHLCTVTLVGEAKLSLNVVL